MFRLKPRYPSVEALMSSHNREALSVEDFDTELWLLLVSKIKKPSDIPSGANPVCVYYASRLVQWEIGNGGFTQAVESASEWLSSAAHGYRALGFAEMATLIERADRIRAELEGESLEEKLEELNAELGSIEWEVDQERVAYVQKHIASFSELPW